MKKDSESRQMYLKTILQLEQSRERVRSVDVANELGFSRPSVSCAIKSMRDDGLLTVKDNGRIVLTDEGRARAEQVLERSDVMTRFLKDMGADDVLARETACRMEHILTNEMLEIIRRHTEEKHFSTVTNT